MVHEGMVERISKMRVREQIEKQAGRLNFWLIVFTVLMTLMYTGFCLWQSFGGSKARGQNIDSVFPANPRPMILLCWAAAAITMIFLPEIGKVFAALSLGGVLFFFGYWLNVTSGIKSNLGVDKIPGSDRLGNILIGAYTFDVVIGVAAFLLIALDLWVIGKNLSLHTRGHGSSGLATPVIAHK
jgi:hypothetical protein